MQTPSPSPLAVVLIFGILIYRKLFRAQMLCACRYLPTCSEYTLQAIRAYGAIRGARLGLGRIVRCQPFGGYGADPVK